MQTPMVSSQSSSFIPQTILLPNGVHIDDSQSIDAAKQVHNPPVLQTTLVPIILKIILKISAIESLPEKNSHTIRVLVYAVPVNQLPPLSLWSPHKTQMSNLQTVCEKDTVYGWTGARNSFRLRCWCNAAVLSPQSVQHMFLVIVHYFPSDTSIS